MVQKEYDFNSHTQKKLQKQLNSIINVTTASAIYNVNISFLLYIISQTKPMQSNQEIV